MVNSLFSGVYLMTTVCVCVCVCAAHCVVGVHCACTRVSPPVVLTKGLFQLQGEVHVQL